MYYNTSVPMVLFFSHCYNIKLHNTSTSTRYWQNSRVHQFVVGVNLCGDSEIKTILPDESSNEQGNSLFVYFADTAILPPALQLDCNLNITTNSLTSSAIPFVDAALTFKLHGKIRVGHYNDFVLFLTQSFIVNVKLNIGPSIYMHDNRIFTSKVVFVNSDTASHVSFQGYNQPYTLCASNESSATSMWLKVLFYETSGFKSKVRDILHPMRIHDTAFTRYLAIKKLTARSAISHQVTLSNVSWCDNSATLSVHNQQKNKGRLYLSMTNSYARARSDVIRNSNCLLCLSNIKQINMTGVSYFNGNGGGPVISLVTSDLEVSGNLTIIDGHARQGGGIFMDGLSTLAFEEPLVAGFYSNIANQGSAIYSPIGQKREGNIQIRPNKEHIYSLSNVTSINISLYFWNNTEGVLHRSFYAPHFRSVRKQTSPNLLFNRHAWDYDRSQFAYTTLIDTILHMDRMDKYTSLANGFCIQPHQQEWECGYLDHARRTPDYFQHPCLTPSLSSAVTYPGQKAFSLYHLDTNTGVSAIYCYNDSYWSSVDLHMGRDNYTLSYRFIDSAVQTGYYIVLFRNRDLLYFPVFEFNATACPVGFGINNARCTCYPELTSHGYHCDIDTETITSPLRYWTGLEEDGGLLWFGDLCHPKYCDSDRHDFHLTDDPAEACLGNRTGVLCGECKENYSVVFGSDTCYDHCTDVYLLTITAYALAGLLLVFLLFTLRITVATGTINGLIFYTNMLGLVLDQLTEDKVQNSNYMAFVHVFISLLNLDLGFPLCFYEGMTMAGKVGFQFLFPVYLWSIVVMLILLSKFSIRLSELISKSSVQVLATLFYLSFSKVLSTVILVFSSSTISVIKGPGNYTSRLVWYYDGHDYGSSTHAILLSLAVAFTVLFLLPYGLLVTFSSFLLRFRIVNKFKPFIDAYGGPFKDKWRFWFGLRLWITILLFCLNGALQGTNTRVMFVVIITTVVSFMFLQNFVRLFKNSFIGALDLFFMVNYCLLSLDLFFYYLLVSSERDIFWWVYIFMTATAVLATVLIVSGHLFALSETCRAKCVNMLPQPERSYYQFHEVVQDDVEDMELFSAAEDRDRDTY